MPDARRTSPAPRTLRRAAGAAVASLALLASAPLAPAQVPPVPPLAAPRDPAQVIGDPDVGLPDRAAAAASLLAQGALSPIRQALAVSPPGPAALAVASALAQPALFSLPDPPEEFLTPLLAAVDRAGPETRTTYTAALGAFRARPAARRLVQLLDAAEPQAVRSAAFTALVRITGRDDLGLDPARWNAWWADAQRMTEGDWRFALARGHADRATRLAGEVESLSRQLVAARSEVFSLTPADQRVARLVEWMQADRPELRLLAFDLAERELLNGRTLGQNVADAATGRLTDGDGAVRAAAARLLGNLGVPDQRRLLETLTTERDARAASALLTALARRPGPALVPLALRWLAQDAAADAASEALLALAQSGYLTSPSDRDEALLLLGDPATLRLTAPRVRLAAMLGGSSGRAVLADRLASAPEGARPILAEALTFWGDTCDRLIEAARTDPSLYTAAARALALHRPTAASVELLDSLPAPNPERRAAGRTRLFEALPPRELRDAARRETDAVVRAAMLSRVAEAAQAGVLGPPSLCAELILDLAEARSAIGDLQGALAALDRVPRSVDAASLRRVARLRTIGLIRLNRLTDPALDAAPVSDWFEGLRAVVGAGAEHASTVCERIRSKFGGRLSVEQEQELDRLVRETARPAGSPAPTGRGGSGERPSAARTATPSS